MEKKTIKVALRENKTATADKAPYLMTLRDGAGTVHVVEVESARRECLNCRAPRTAASGEGLLEITLVGGKKGDCRFTASRKVRILA